MRYLDLLNMVNPLYKTILCILPKVKYRVHFQVYSREFKTDVHKNLHGNIFSIFHNSKNVKTTQNSSNNKCIKSSSFIQWNSVHS